MSVNATHLHKDSPGAHRVNSAGPSRTLCFSANSSQSWWLRMASDICASLRSAAATAHMKQIPFGHAHACTHSRPHRICSGVRDCRCCYPECNLSGLAKKKMDSVSKHVDARRQSLRPARGRGLRRNLSFLQD